MHNCGILLFYCTVPASCITVVFYFFNYLMILLLSVTDFLTVELQAVRMIAKKKPAQLLSEGDGQATPLQVSAAEEEAR